MFSEMYFVYVLRSINFERHYVGLSSDVLERLKSHNGGNVVSTRPFRPWKIIHIEEFKTRAEAREREKYLKSAAGRRWRKNNLGD